MTYDYWTAPTQEDRIPWDTVSLVHAGMIRGACTTRLLVESTGLRPAAIYNGMDWLRKLGHRIHTEYVRGTCWFHYLRPPGKHPCPDCGSLLRSSQPHYICDCCRDRRIADGRDIWPSIEEG
jgi:hypothetical protein